MNKRDLAYSILYQIENFFLLQEIDYLATHNIQLITPVLDEIYSNRSFDWRNHFPIISSATTLCTLFIPISYLAGLSNEKIEELGFKYKDEYGITCEHLPTPITIKVVLKIIRNSIAHLCDFESHINQNEFDATLYFGSSIVSFKTRNEETLTFEKPEGFVKFISDLISAIKAGCKKFLQEPS